jgi:hypothetical protein
MLRSNSFLTALSVAGALLACSSTHAKTRIGVIVTSATEKEKFVPLLELRLSQHPSVVLVERRDIEKVLREQELQALLAPDAPDKRAALGKMLKADLLVFLSRGDKPKPHVVITVCETQQGLRLRIAPVLLTGKPENEGDDVFKQIEAAARKLHERIADIVAVPPLVNNSLTHEADYLQGAYAQFIESSLLHRPGLLVVELAEAKALAREIVLSGSQGIDRRLPLYLMGEYRFEGTGQARRGQFTWKLLRGEKELDHREEKDLVIDYVSDRLHQAALDLVDRALGKVEAPTDLEAEARNLAKRAHTFIELGAWQEAWDTAEASLLLKPDQPDVHGDILNAIDGVYQARLRTVRPNQLEKVAPQDAIELIRLFRAAVPHMEAYSQATKVPLNFNPSLGIGGAWPLFTLKALTPELREACLELREDLRAVAVRILAAKVAGKVEVAYSSYGWTWLIFWAEPPFESKNDVTYFCDIMRPPRFNYYVGDDSRREQFKPWLTQNFTKICEIRLKLLRDFAWLRNMNSKSSETRASPWAPFVSIYEPAVGSPLLLSDPIYVDFLRKAAKLPSPSLKADVQALLDEIAKQPEELEKHRKLREEFAKQMADRRRQGLMPLAPSAIQAPFVPVADPEVVFHPINLTASVRDHQEAVFISKEVGAPETFRLWSPLPGLWIPGDGCDMLWIDKLTAKPGAAIYKHVPPNTIVLVKGNAIGLVKERGRLHLLPLDILPLGNTGYPSACWDGRYFWIMTAGVASPSAKDHGEKGLLAAIDPRTERIWRFSRADGLPPSSSCAIASMAPGKVCVAGDFGRTWMAIATIDVASGIKLDTIYEARKLAQSLGVSTDPKGSDPQVAHPVSYMRVVARPVEPGKPAQQWIIVGRSSRTPWLLDPEKKEASCPDFKMATDVAIVADNAVYCCDIFPRFNRTGVQECTPLYRFGFPDFKTETVNGQWVSGKCAFFGGRYHVARIAAITNSQLREKPAYYIASSLRDAPRKRRCDIPGNFPAGLCVSSQYGLVMTTNTGFYQVETKDH